MYDLNEANIFGWTARLLVALQIVCCCKRSNGVEDAADVDEEFGRKLWSVVGE